jgi:hypothetical protein
MTNHDRFASVFKKRIGRTLSTAEIARIMLTESDIQLGQFTEVKRGICNLSLATG